MRILLAIAVALLAVIAALLGIQTYNHPADTWSYVVIAPTDVELIETLNKAGALGWEVVSARRATNGQGVSSSASYEMILKRRGATVPPQQEWKPTK